MRYKVCYPAYRTTICYSYAICSAEGTPVCLWKLLHLHDIKLPTFTTLFVLIRGTQWPSWLRHRATSLVVTRSIWIFHRLNPSGCTMALRSTQPLPEMSTRNISWWGKGSQCVQLTTLTPSCANCRNSGSLTLLET